MPTAARETRSDANAQLKDEVRSFWEEDPCGAEHGTAREGTPEFFAQVAAKRDSLEPFIADFADFGSTRHERVLEIGVGVGSDFIRFVRAGARATGVDLTQHSIELVRRRLGLEGLDADLRQADAERRPSPMPASTSCTPGACCTTPLTVTVRSLRPSVSSSRVVVCASCSTPGVRGLLSPYGAGTPCCAAGRGARFMRSSLRIWRAPELVPIRGRNCVGASLGSTICA